MNDNVQPVNGMLIVCECEHPFAKPASKFDLSPMLANTRLHWNRVIASAWVGAEPGDLVCIGGNAGDFDKLFMDGGVCYGSVHGSTVKHVIKKQHASHVRDMVRTPDIEQRAIEEVTRQEQSRRLAANGGGMVIPGRLVN